MLDLLISSPWPGLALWMALYVCDYSLTIASARLYRRQVAAHIVFEGSFELTPLFQKDVDALRRVSPRFIGALLWMTALLSLLWYTAVASSILPDAYAVGLGAMVLLEVAINMRHLRNYHLFRTGVGEKGLRGRLEYPRPLILRMSSIELACFAALFLLLSVLTESWFVLGGAASCIGAAIKHARMAREHPGTIAGAAAGEGAPGTNETTLDVRRTGA